jgi:hypothetical protein
LAHHPETSRAVPEKSNRFQSHSPIEVYYVGDGSEVLVAPRNLAKEAARSLYQACGV